MTEEQVQKVAELLQKSELDNTAQELMRNFFESICHEPQFDKMIDLLDRFPTLFENFCKCFIYKKSFLATGASEDQWNDYLVKEKEIFHKQEQ